MKIPKIVIPALVILFILGGYLIQPLFFFPTTESAFAAKGDSTVEFTVEGLRCRGTAAFFTSLFDDVPGIESITTYAANNKAIFRYNSELISPHRIKSIFEREFRMRDGSFSKAFKEISRSE